MLVCCILDVYLLFLFVCTESLTLVSDPTSRLSLGSYVGYFFRRGRVVQGAGRNAKRMVLQCINGVSSNPVEGIFFNCLDIIRIFFFYMFVLNIFIFFSIHLIFAYMLLFFPYMCFFLLNNFILSCTCCIEIKLN